MPTSPARPRSPTGWSAPATAGVSATATRWTTPRSVCRRDFSAAGSTNSFIARRIRWSLGFAVARDLGTFPARNDATNPVAHGPRTRSIVMGTSQGGRFIRSMIALGFNRGEDGKQVFDAPFPHIGGGLMPLNLRFSQPGRAWGQQVDHDFPAYDFPFTDARQFGPLTGRTQGLLEPQPAYLDHASAAQRPHRLGARRPRPAGVDHAATSRAASFRSPPPALSATLSVIHGFRWRSVMRTNPPMPPPCSTPRTRWWRSGCYSTSTRNAWWARRVRKACAPDPKPKRRTIG